MKKLRIIMVKRKAHGTWLIRKELGFEPLALTRGLGLSASQLVYSNLRAKFSIVGHLAFPWLRAQLLQLSSAIFRAILISLRTRKIKDCCRRGLWHGRLGGQYGFFLRPSLPTAGVRPEFWVASPAPQLRVPE